MSTSRSKRTGRSADPILHDAFEKKESIPQAWSARRPQAHPAAARAHAPPSPSRLLLTSSPRTPKRDAPSHARDHALARRVRRAGPRPHQLPSYLLTSSPAPPLIPVVCQGCHIRGALEAGAEGCLIRNVWGACSLACGWRSLNVAHAWRSLNLAQSVTQAITELGLQVSSRGSPQRLLEGKGERLELRQEPINTEESFREGRVRPRRAEPPRKSLRPRRAGVGARRRLA